MLVHKALLVRSLSHLSSEFYPLEIGLKYQGLQTRRQIITLQRSFDPSLYLIIRETKYIHTFVQSRHHNNTLQLIKANNNSTQHSSKDSQHLTLYHICGYLYTLLNKISTTALTTPLKYFTNNLL